MPSPGTWLGVDPLPVWEFARERSDAADGQIYVFCGGRGDCPDSRAIFATRFLYYISTEHTADACGFSGGYADALRARNELADFLERAMEHCGDLQLYVALTFYGDSGVVPSSFDYLGPSDLRTWMTELTPGDFFQVIRED